MRLPVTPQVSTKDGISNKNARLTNAVKEQRQTGDLAVVRPGLAHQATYTGVGGGLIDFDKTLLSVYDDVVYTGGVNCTEFDLSSDDWSSTATYSSGDQVWYNGDLWVSKVSSNLNNIPQDGENWATRYDYCNTWSPTTSYDIGDEIIWNGLPYYSYIDNNLGNRPFTENWDIFWQEDQPTSARFRASITALGLTGAGNPGPICASRLSAAFSAYDTATAMISCATKFPATQTWYEFVGVELIAGIYYVRAQQWSDAPPFDCSVAPLDLGVASIGTIQQIA